MAFVAHSVPLFLTRCETGPLHDGRCLKLVIRLALSDEVTVDVGRVLVQKTVRTLRAKQYHEEGACKKEDKKDCDEDTL